MALDFARIAAAALVSAETLVPRWLPGGKRSGREWKCGNLQGEPGDSCSVNLATGKWADFATGEIGGDLVSLYAAVQRISQADAARALAEQLGVQIEASGGTAAAPKPALKVASRTDWRPILPAPADAGPAPVAHVVRGKPTHRWEYRDAEGRLLGVIYRFTTSDGGKEVLPCVYAENPKGARDWRWLSFPVPRPLYGLDRLQPTGPVLLVEGEKCADAAREHIPATWSVLTWPGGSKAVDKADWTPIRGRKVVIWPDCDEAGHSAARKISGLLEEQGCKVRILEVPIDSKPKGWDVADAVAEGLVGDELRAWILARVPAEPAPPSLAGARVEESELDSWRRALIKRGFTPQDCRENVMLSLTMHPELADLVAMNDFAGRAEKRREAPWGGPPGEWTPRDDRELGLWLAQRCGLLIKSETNIGAGVEMAATRNAWHPVRDWLRACKPCDEERLDHWMVACLGAEPTEYVRRVSRLMLLQLVARVMQPGCKADHMTILEGPQGKGKSSALRALADPWFSDAPFRVGDKDSFLQLAGVWLYEISEMDAFNRSEVTAVKAFVSQITDRFREPYGRRVIARARQTVLGGTTNQDAYLRDLTGNRRFWPVRVGPRIDLELLQEWREPLFAEALRAFEAGEPWWPTRAEESEHFAPQQDARTIEDPWREILAAWIDDPEQLTRADVTTVELLQAALKVPSERIDSTGQMAKRVVAAMTSLGWKQQRTRRPNGAYVRAWMRPDPAAVTDEAADEVPL